MPDFDPRKDEDRAYLAGALTAYALGLKAEDVLSGGRGSPAESRARQVAMLNQPLNDQRAHLSRWPQRIHRHSQTLHCDGM